MNEESGKTVDEQAHDDWPCEMIRFFGTTYKKYINITEDNTVHFTIQDGPIGMTGENGCMIDDVILFARKVIEKYDKRIPCKENKHVIIKLTEALQWLKTRTEDREARRVEGTDMG